MTDEIEETENTKENIGGVGQAILGELEIIGGILTGDPISQAEGEFNVEAGNLRTEVSEELAESNKAENTNQAE